MTCEGALVIFLIILLSISNPPFKNATRELIASKIHLYNLLQDHKLPNLKQAGRAEPCQCVGGAEPNGAALSGGRGGKKSTLVIL